MKSINIFIKTTNDAFADYPSEEIVRILRKIANDLETDSTTNANIMDINGNNVGIVNIKR